MEKRNVYRDLGVRVRKIRKESGLTQERLAFNAKISPTFLSHIERGAKKASLHTVQKLADALGIPIRNLFCLPKEPVVYPKNEEDLFLRRLKGLVADRGEEFEEVIWKVARYLTEKKE